MKVDVCIVGAGMVGLALANHLHQAGFRVALIEKDPPPEKISAAVLPLRVSAISLASQQLFSTIGAWDEIQQHAAPYEDMFVWDAATPAEITLSAAHVHRPYLGHIIENSRIQQALYACAQANEMPCFLPDTVAQVQRTATGCQVELASGQSIQAGLLVAADGVQSPLRARMGITCEPTLYQQTAFVGVVRMERSHDKTAWQRFLSTGPVAFLPLPDAQQCSFVWSVDDEQAEVLKTLSDDDFSASLADAIEQRFGQVNVLTERAGFPLKHQHAARYTQPHFALVGDAAHAIHPLAGQGVNLGFLDVFALVDTLQAAREQRRPLGLQSDLQRYASKRRWHNAAMLKAMTGINALFKQTNPVVKTLRHFGVRQANDLMPLKQYFIAQATGESWL